MLSIAHSYVFFTLLNLVNHKTDQLEANFSKPSFSIQEENWADKSSADKTSYRRLAFTSSATTRESNTDGKPINTTFDIEDASVKNTTKRSNFNINVTFDLEDPEDRSKLFVKSKGSPNKNATFDIEDPFLLSSNTSEALETFDNESYEVNPLSRSYIRQITYNIPKHNSFLANSDSCMKSNEKFENTQHYQGDR